MTTVSVIFVNFRGAQDTLTAVEHLRQCDWPAQNLEVIIVDNDSGDGSYELLSSSLPDCTVLQSGANLGFAGGCNFGAAHATGEILGFLNTDARPHALWISEAVAAFEANARVGCVASKVLDWEGTHIDYVSGSLTWFGMGYKDEVGRPDDGSYDTPCNVLFATGAAMFTRKSVFDELDGFDERFFMFHEDTDYGWRVNLAGYDVRYVPTSVAYHRHHSSMDANANSARETYLLNRNSFACMYKNFGTELLQAVLAPALALAVDRSASNVEDPLGQESDTFRGAQVPEAAAAAPFALAAFLDMLPSLQQTRARIQTTRRRSDAQILDLMRNPLQPMCPGWRLQVHLDTYNYFDIGPHLAAQNKILVVTGDYLGPKMAGPAIRAWEIAKRLGREHEVRLCTTSTKLGLTKGDGFTVVNPRTDPELALQTTWADIIVFQGLLLEQAPWLKTPSKKILVADIYDPLHLEQLEQRRDNGPQDRENTLVSTTGMINTQLRLADFLLCASEKQRRFWLGELASVGRINKLNLSGKSSPDELIGVCPFGLDEEPPLQTEHALRGKVPGIGMDDKVIIWGGGIYNWFDPLTLIRAIAQLKDAHPEIRLYFMGIKNPNPSVPAMRMAQETIDLSAELGLTDRYVFFNYDWVPFNERQNYLLDADLGVSTHFEHVETQYSFRTRILDYLWTGLPIVATKGDSFGNVLEQEGIGIGVDPKDVEGLATAIERLLFDESRLAACRANVARYAQQFQWNNTLKPLIEFCRNPRRATDLER